MNFLNQSFFLIFFLLFDWVKSYGRVKGAIANLWFLRREEGGILFLLWAQWDLKVPYFLSFCNSDVVNVGQQPPLWAAAWRAVFGVQFTVHCAQCIVYTALYCIARYSTKVYCTALHCTVLQVTELPRIYCNTSLHWTILMTGDFTAQSTLIQEPVAARDKVGHL